MSHHNYFTPGSMRYKIIVALLSSFLSLLLTTQCYALENRTETVTIQADQMYFDMQSNTSIYQGNVKIKQGTIELLGDIIEIHQKNDVITQITAEGNPAKFSQSTADGSDIRAQSKLIKYFSATNRLVMINQAILIQDDQIIESERIEYDTDKQTLLAGQKQSEQSKPSQRVKITLTPNNKE